MSCQGSRVFACSSATTADAAVPITLLAICSLAAACRPCLSQRWSPAPTRVSWEMKLQYPSMQVCWAAICRPHCSLPDVHSCSSCHLLQPWILPGIGYEIARAFAQRAGTRTVLTARNEERGAAAVQKIKADNPSAEVGAAASWTAVNALLVGATRRAAAAGFAPLPSALHRVQARLLQYTALPVGSACSSLSCLLSPDAPPTHPQVLCWEPPSGPYVRRLQLLVHQLDITDEGSVQRFASWARAELKTIDVLCNNAGEFLGDARRGWTRGEVGLGSHAPASLSSRRVRQWS